MFRLRRNLGIALLFATVFAVFAIFPLEAQAQPPAGKLFLVHREHADPAKLTQYEATSAEFRNAIREHKITSFPLNYMAWSYDDLTYDFIAPMNGYEDLARISATFEEIGQKMGAEKFGDLMARGNATMTSWDDVIIRERPDLGYVPSSPRVSDLETGAIRFDYYYLRPGAEQELDQLAKDWRALSAAKGIRDGYRVFETVFGPNLPLFVVATPGKDAADLATAWAANVKTGGAEWQALMARTLGLCHKFESKVGTWRGDLSAR